MSHKGMGHQQLYLMDTWTRQAQKTTHMQTVHISDTQQLLQMTKEEFLSNTENKQRFIYMLGARLEANECEVHNAKGDADLLVVEVAVACADRTETVVISDDTDILCLLVHHTGKARHNIWFQPNPSRESSKAKRC